MRVGVVEFIDSAHSAMINGKSMPLHGHTYKIEVAVDGPVKDGIVYDFCELRDIVKEVLKKYHKKNLNDVLENSTGENFALALHKDLKAKLPKHLKLFVKIWQGHNKWVEYGD